LSLKFTLFSSPSNKEQILSKHSREPEITFFTLFLHNGYHLPDREILATKTGEKQMSGTETDEQIKLRTVLGWHLKQLLDEETKPALPKNQSNGTQKKPTRQKL